MSDGLKSAADVEANKMTRSEYTTMLADGTGLSADAADKAREKWIKVQSLVDDLFLLPGTDLRNFRRGAKGSSSNPITRADPRSMGSVLVIASKVAAAITGNDVATGVGVEMILNNLGETIGAAAFGLSPTDLHSSGDEPRWRALLEILVSPSIH